ncbi:MAG: hypothetical protein AB7G17_14140 [Phycisphaerales bacterium]
MASKLRSATLAVVDLLHDAWENPAFIALATLLAGGMCVFAIATI